jgi:hypothetical protein
MQAGAGAACHTHRRRATASQPPPPAVSQPPCTRSRPSRAQFCPARASAPARAAAASEPRGRARARRQRAIRQACSPRVRAGPRLERPCHLVIFRHERRRGCCALRHVDRAAAGHDVRRGGARRGRRRAGRRGRRARGGGAVECGDERALLGAVEPVLQPEGTRRLQRDQVLVLPPPPRARGAVRPPGAPRAAGARGRGGWGGADPQVRRAGRGGSLRLRRCRR